MERMMDAASTVSAVLEAQVAERPNQVLVACDDERLTYAEADRLSREFARGLLGMGLGRGTHVGLCLPAGVDLAVAWLAVVRIGAVAAPITALSTADEIASLPVGADLQGLITTPMYSGNDYVAALRRAFPSLDLSRPELIDLVEAPHLRRIVVLGDAPGVDDFHAYAGLHRAARMVDPDLVDLMGAEVRPDDPMVFVHNGSANQPGGVVHTHGGLLEELAAVNAARGLTAEMKMLSVSPLFWVGGKGFNLVGALLAGATLVSSSAEKVSRVREGEARAQADAEAQARALAEQEQADAEAQARALEEQAQAEAEAQARALEEQARAEVEEQARALMARAQVEEEAAARALASRAQAEEEARQRQETEARADARAEEARRRQEAEARAEDAEWARVVEARAQAEDAEWARVVEARVVEARAQAEDAEWARVEAARVRADREALAFPSVERTALAEQTRPFQPPGPLKPEIVDDGTLHDLMLVNDPTLGATEFWTRNPGRDAVVRQHRDSQRGRRRTQIAVVAGLVAFLLACAAVLYYKFVPRSDPNSPAVATARYRLVSDLSTPGVTPLAGRTLDVEPESTAGVTAQWTAGTGTIVSDPGGAAGDSGTTAQAPAIAVVTPEKRPLGLTAVIRPGGNAIGVVFRYRDPQNYWSLVPMPAYATWNLYSTVGGRQVFQGNTGLSGTDAAKVRIELRKYFIRVDVGQGRPIALPSFDLVQERSVGLIARLDLRAPSRCSRFTVLVP